MLARMQKIQGKVLGQMRSRPEHFMLKFVGLDEEVRKSQEYPPKYLTPRRPIAHADTDLTPSFSCANPNKTLQILLINLFYLIIIIIYTVSEVTVFSLLYRDQKQRERLINDFLFHLFIYFTRKKKIERDNPKGQKEWERIERRDMWYFSLSLFSHSHCSLPLR